MGVRGFESDVVNSFKEGVINAVTADMVPDEALRQGRNTKFHNVGPGVAWLGTRDGFSPLNETALAGGLAINNLHFFKTDSGSAILFTNTDGADSSLYNWDGAAATLIGSAGDFTPAFFSFINVNNYAFGVNGTEMIKTDGTNWWQLGIERPASSVFTAAANGAGHVLPAGDYDVLVTWYNENTGQEGPRSNDTLTVTITAGQQLRVVLPSIATIGDSQVTHARIYLRQQSTTNQFFNVIAGATPGVDTDVEAFSLDATLTTTVDIDATQDQIDAFITLAPDVNANLLTPESPFTFIANYRQRVIGCDLYNIYWTDLTGNESFNTEDNKLPVGIKDGEPITGMAVHDDTLVIFKRNRTYYLDGDDPETWVIRVLDPITGNVGAKSFAIEGDHLYFFTLQGPHRWSRANGVEDITHKVLTTFDADIANTTAFDTTVIITNHKSHTVAWAIPVITDYASVLVLPFNTQMERWESDGWDCLNITASAPIINTDGQSEPIFGDEFGNLYTGLQNAADGVPVSCTILSTNLISAASATEITVDIDADDHTLIGRYAWIWQTDNDGTIIDAVKSLITDNVGGVLTLDVDLPTVPDTTTQNWRFALGGIFQDMRTGFRNGNVPFFRKRIEFMFLEFFTSAAVTDMVVQAFKNQNDLTPLITKQLTFEGDQATETEGALWDTALWDEARWDAGSSTSGTINPHVKRIAIKHVGHSWQNRVVFMGTGAIMVLQRIGVQWLSKTKKAEY